MTMKMRPLNVRDSVGTGNGKASYSDKRQHKIVEAERNERAVSGKIRVAGIEPATN